MIGGGPFIAPELHCKRVESPIHVCIENRTMLLLLLLLLLSSPSSSSLLVLLVGVVIVVVVVVIVVRVTCLRTQPLPTTKYGTCFVACCTAWQTRPLRLSEVAPCGFTRRTHRRSVQWRAPPSAP